MTATPHMDRLEREFAEFFGPRLVPKIAPPMRPDALDVYDMNNNAIEPIRDSAIAAEDAGQMPRTNYNGEFA